MTVRTRFAPSPTGYLHIGGVRTALFNWLFARKHGGQFILRIDDTDQQRNVAEALQPILDGFRWLGLDWDEGAEIGGPHGPYYQSQKLERYQEAVRQLLDKGLAYWDYAKPEEMKVEREAAEKEQRPIIYSRRWMAETDADRKRFEAEGRQGAVKAKMPREGACEFKDHIRGDVRVEWAGEQDIVIQRSDGTVTYNLANVVDDFDMKITHVIRAEEHLSNTPRQIFMLEGLGYPRPEFAHLPFVAEPGSKNKLSKRKIAQYLKNAEFKKVYEHGSQIEKKTDSGQVSMLRATAQEIKNGVRVERVPRLLAALSTDPRNQPLHSSILDRSDTEKTIILLEQFADTIQARRATGAEQLAQHGILILLKTDLSLPPETFNPVIVDFYKHVGYLPDAIINYLLLLGWSLDDKTEDFTRQQMIDLFSLERVNKGPASFDAKKLFAFQERHMLAVPLAEKVTKVVPFLVKAGLVSEPVTESTRQTIEQIVAAAGPRIRVFGDILDFEDFFLPTAQLRYDEKALEKHVRKPPGSEWVAGLKAIVASAEPFDAPTLKTAVEAFIQAQGAKPMPVSQTLRVLVTGKEVGFGTYETLAILGREKCLERIERAQTQP